MQKYNKFYISNLVFGFFLGLSLIFVPSAVPIIGKFIEFVVSHSLDIFFPWMTRSFFGIYIMIYLVSIPFFIFNFFVPSFIRELSLKRGPFLLCSFACFSLGTLFLYPLLYVLAFLVLRNANF